MTPKYVFQPTLAWAVWAVVNSVATQAAADTTTASNPLEEIVITASRVQQRVFDSPASLSVINAQALDRATSPTLAEVMRDIPGVQVTDSGQPGLGRVRLRGEESRRTAILVNGQEITDHHEVGTPLTLNPSLVERVEVVRGSGSVLYGSRALSGVINFITRKGGTRALQASVSGGYDTAASGYNNFASVYGNLGGTGYRLAWSRSDYGNRSTPEGDMQNTSFSNDSLYGFIGRDFGDHRLEYTWEDYQSSSHIYVEEELKTTFPLTDFYLETPQRDRRKNGFFYTWTLENNWLRDIEVNAYRQTSKRHFYTRTDTVWYKRNINTRGVLDTDGALLQANLNPIGNHQWIWGLQYLNDDVDQTRHVDTSSWTPPIASGIDIIRDRASIETWAWFTQDQWQLSDNLSLVAGARQYFVDGNLDYSDRESLSPGSLDSDNRLIGSLGLVWDYSDTVRLRANVAQGYIYPSLMQLATGAYAGSRFVNPDANLKPETSITYETGMRVLHAGLSMDVTAFYTASDDYIDHLACTAQDNCPGSRDQIYLNVGKSQAQGLELAVAYQWSATNLQPYANLTWMKRRNEFDDFKTWDTGIPRLGGRAGLRWEGAWRALPELWSDLYLRGESSSTLAEPGGLRDALNDKKSWLSINLAAGANFGSQQQYQLSLELINLADKSYIASTENLYGAERSLAVKISVEL